MKKVLFLTVIAVLLCSCSCSDNTVDLQGSVSFDGMKFEIKNNDVFDYENAKFEVNDIYLLEGINIKASETYTVDIFEFADKNGNRMNLMIKPLKFTIWCDIPNDKNGFLMGTW